MMKILWKGKGNGNGNGYGNQLGHYACKLAPTPDQPPSHGDSGKGSRWSRGTVKTGPLRKNNYFEAYFEALKTFF